MFIMLMTIADKVIECIILWLYLEFDD